MSLTINLPTGYPWVLATVGGSVFLNIWQIILVAGARKQAGIKYPQLYASKEQETSSEKARIFNCTQRAHQNTLEYAPMYIFCTLVAGLCYPRVAVSLATVNLVGRIFYTIGYSSGVPQKRLKGYYPSTMALIGLGITMASTVFQLLYKTDFQL